ncbi:MAG: hypothetical protein GX235_04885 [Clostridiales bacterium]|nr:hypothetical protein [Clostridiales bacterium]
MEKDTLYIQEIVNGFKVDVERLIKYIPWLESKVGVRVSNMYKGEGIEEHSMSFPVYDSTLMSLVQDARRTNLLDRNYAYVYSRNRIRSEADEQRLIAAATIREMDMLKGILSKYILGGMTKGKVWTEGVYNGSILKVLLKMKEIIEYWDRPIGQNTAGMEQGVHIDE